MRNLTSFLLLMLCNARKELNDRLTQCVHGHRLHNRNVTVTKLRVFDEHVHLSKQKDSLCFTKLYSIQVNLSPCPPRVPDMAHTVHTTGVLSPCLKSQTQSPPPFLIFAYEVPSHRPILIILSKQLVQLDAVNCTILPIRYLYGTGNNTCQKALVASGCNCLSRNYCCGRKSFNCKQVCTQWTGQYCWCLFITKPNNATSLTLSGVCLKVLK